MEWGNSVLLRPVADVMPWGLAMSVPEDDSVLLTSVYATGLLYKIHTLLNVYLQPTMIIGCKLSR